MKPRHYQTDGLDAVAREFEAGNDTLLVRPTGMGKTIELAHVIDRRPGGAIVMAHREELIFQNAQKIEAVTGEQVDIEMAEHQAHAGGLLDRNRIISASVQTLNAGRRQMRMERFNPMHFETLVIDEAHHAPSATYRRVVEYFKQNPSLRVLGVTATPDRADELALGSVFDTVAHSITIDEAIAWGWLVDVECMSVHVDGLDYDEIRTTAGDLNGGDLERVMLYENNLQRIALPTLDIIKGKRAIVFAASVAHAERLAEIFNRYRPGSTAWICGKTPKPERKVILKQFREGLIQTVVNVGVLTEGFDDHGIECVVLARPTKSRALYCQMLGRGTRTHPGINALDASSENAEGRREWIANSAKPSVLCVDFVGNTTRHRLVHASDILGGNEPEAVCERATRIIEEAGEPMQMRDAMTAAADQIAIEEEEKKRREEEQARKRKEEQEAARRALVRARAEYTATANDPFRVFGVSEPRSLAWDKGNPPTEKMVAFLKKQGIAQSDINRMSSGDAGRMINEIKTRMNYGKATFKQAALLKRHGLPTDVTKKQATEWIDAIAANGWKLPEGLGDIEIRRY